MMNHYRDIIKAPIITEKTAAIAEDGRSYVFKVDTKANKTEIYRAHADLGTSNSREKPVV